MHTGQIDVTPRAESPRSNDSGADPSSAFFKDRQPDHAVVHQDVVANGDIIYQSVVIHTDRIRLLCEWRSPAYRAELRWIGGPLLRAREFAAQFRARSRDRHGSCSIEEHPLLSGLIGATRRVVVWRGRACR